MSHCLHGSVCLALLKRPALNLPPRSTTCSTNRQVHPCTAAGNSAMAPGGQAAAFPRRRVQITAWVTAVGLRGAPRVVAEEQPWLQKRRLRTIRQVHRRLAGRIDAARCVHFWPRGHGRGCGRGRNEHLWPHLDFERELLPSVLLIFFSFFFFSGGGGGVGRRRPPPCASPARRRLQVRSCVFTLARSHQVDARVLSSGTTLQGHAPCEPRGGAVLTECKFSTFALLRQNADRDQRADGRADMEVGARSGGSGGGCERLWHCVRWKPDALSHTHADDGRVRGRRRALH